jgi:hypothetical protein
LQTLGLRPGRIFRLTTGARATRALHRPRAPEEAPRVPRARGTAAGGSTGERAWVA